MHTQNYFICNNKNKVVVTASCGPFSGGVVGRWMDEGGNC